jgi:hypothetical protein
MEELKTLQFGGTREQQELTDDYKHIGMGQGGYREDHMYYSSCAGI